MMLSRWLRLDVAASVFAGFLGAGVVDLLLVLTRGQGARPAEAVALAIGLYGALGLVLGAAVSWATAMALGGLPSPLGAHPHVDRRVAAGILSGAVGAGALAVFAAAGFAVLVSPMHSKAPATIATAGVTVLAAALAVGVA